MTLGAYLDEARREAGYSLRTLARAAGVPMSSVNRLLKDEVARPDPGNLARLAGVLGLRAGDLLVRAGLPRGDLDELLRRDYGLSEEAIVEVRGVIEGYTSQERGS